MESDGLLGSEGKSGLTKVAGIIFVILVVGVAAISITAIVLSVQAINTSNDLSAQNEKTENCNFRATRPTVHVNANRDPLNDLYVLIKNGVIWLGNGTTLQNYDILIEQGIITQIAAGINPTPNVTVYDVAGAFVTPGLVDMHSHLGVYSYPEDSFGTSDGNEVTDPTSPEVRVIDALDPEDKAIPQIRSGGITTSLVLPGSANVIGGQGLPIKMKGKTVANMIIPNSPLVFKMASGENPKRAYGSDDKLPMTRMGSIWTMRRIFSSAYSLRIKQDQWDCIASAGTRQSDARPYDAKLEPVVQILRGEAIIMVHGYEVQDFEAVLRVADEFGVKITAFHHALEAWKIPEVFAERNITLAIFSDMWGFKMEGFDGSVYGPLILSAANAPVAFKSDHPVIYAKYLLNEAAKGFHYGLNVDAALQAVTVVPAKAVGLFDRVGSIEVGKDGDVVVWDRHPLVNGASPLKVFIEGELYNISAKNPQTPTTPVVSVTPLSTTPTTACSGAALTSYTVVDATVYTGTVSIVGANIVVINGIVSCADLASNGCVASGATFSVPGGVVLPGIISSSTDVGLMEVESEGDSQDGAANLDNGANIYAADGIKVQTRHIWAAFAGGVTSHVAIPQGNGLIAGYSATFYTDPIFKLPSDAIFSNATALHINIGNNAKISGSTRSVSSQFATLRSYFRTALSDGASNPLYPALTGTYPIVFRVDQADEIDAVIRLKNQFAIPRVAILGGAEAHLVATKLAAAGVGVILAPLRNAPHLFETLRTSPETAPGILAAAGVPVALAQTDPAWVRNLRWEAGYSIDGGLTYLQAVASVTSTVAQILNLPAGLGTITPGTQANFVLYNGDPLSLNSQLSAVFLGTSVNCGPKQY